MHLQPCPLPTSLLDGSSPPSSTPSSPAPTTTMPPLLAEPLPLTPLRPIPLAQRVRRRLRCHEPPSSTGREGEVHDCRILLPLKTATKTHAYIIEGIVTNKPKTGVLLIRATPIILHNPHDPSASDCLDAHVMSYGKRSVVIKAVHRPERAKRPGPDNPLKEIAALQHLLLHHDHNIIPLLDCMQDEDFIYLVFPYLSGGDLFARVRASNGEGLAESEAASYLRQATEGLVFMKQSSGLAHHDVSLENLMLSSRGEVTIIDLGMSLRVPKIAPSPLASASAVPPPPPARARKKRKYCHCHQEEAVVYLTPQRRRGKPVYISPQVVREEACDPFAADVWSLGVCLYMMLTGRPLYNSPLDTAFHIMSEVGGVVRVVEAYESHGVRPLSTATRDLIYRMLHADPTKRPTLEDVLLHPFLRSATSE